MQSKSESEDVTAGGERSSTAARPLITTAIFVGYVLALSLWAGGLVVLGAIVAPTVFGIVPAPLSADAMTVVFRRFDTIAISCSILVLVAEALLAWAMREKPKRLDVLRALFAVLAAGLAIGEGVYLSPAIEALHRSGAVRFVGDAGRELERLHKLAETTAKAELFLLLTILVLIVAKATRHRDAR